MSDKELLELAAKAAGWSATGWNGECYVIVLDGRSRQWNPLTDDGDALRLAVKLTLLVDVGYSAVLVRGHSENEILEAVGSDAHAATRRAIVRAAAALSRSQ